MGGTETLHSFRAQAAEVLVVVSCEWHCNCISVSPPVSGPWSCGLAVPSLTRQRLCPYSIQRGLSCDLLDPSGDMWPALSLGPQETSRAFAIPCSSAVSRRRCPVWTRGASRVLPVTPGEASLEKLLSVHLELESQEWSSQDPRAAHQPE